MLFRRCLRPRVSTIPSVGATYAVAMVTDIKGRCSHSIVADGPKAPETPREHPLGRGRRTHTAVTVPASAAAACRAARAVVDFELPTPIGDANTFAAGICFPAAGPGRPNRGDGASGAIAADGGIEVLGWRIGARGRRGADIGPTALGCAHFAQLFVAAPERDGVRPAGLALDRLVYPVRKRAGHVTRTSRAAGTGVYFASLSSRTITYKGAC